MFTCFPANFSAFLMYYRKKIKTKIIYIPQALCSVSANNGELVLSSSPKTLYMRHLARLFSCLQLRSVCCVQPLEAGICTRMFYGAVHVQIKYAPVCSAVLVCLGERVLGQEERSRPLTKGKLALT